MASFPIPEVVGNTDGWGPSASSVPVHLADMPFAPFSKADKLGRASDWTQGAYQKYPGRHQQGPQGPAVFNFFHNEEEENFHVVDNRPVKPKPFGQRRFGQQRGGFQGGRGRDSRMDQRDGKPGMDRDRRDGKKPNQGGRPPWQQWNRDQNRATQASSVEIKPEWVVLEQITFQTLQKLSCNVPEPEDLLMAGELEYYDKAYDRLVTKQETPLEKTKRAFRSATTSEDPIIKQLAQEGRARVFGTDTILTTLMCVKSSKYSWDVLLTKQDGKLFFDRRPGSSLQLLTVSENAAEELPDEKDNINGMQQLSLEATAVNQNYTQMVVAKRGNKYKCDQPNPFALPDEEMASCAYRYRKWRLGSGENALEVVVRCEVDAVTVNQRGEEQFMVLKALNEHDIRGQDWRRKLDSQRSAVLAYETKNNKNKVAKWTAAALLAGAEVMKLGYVSRSSPRDNSNHVLLTTQACKPREFAAQISLSMEHGWGIVKAIVDLALSQPDGKYLLVKDPLKELLRLYNVTEEVQDGGSAPLTEAL